MYSVFLFVLKSLTFYTIFYINSYLSPRTNHPKIGCTSTRDDAASFLLPIIMSHGSSTSFKDFHTYLTFSLVTSHSFRFLVNVWRGEMGRLFVYGAPIKLNIMNISIFAFHNIM